MPSPNLLNCKTKAVALATLDLVPRTFAFSEQFLLHFVQAVVSFLKFESYDS